MGNKDLGNKHEWEALNKIAVIEADREKKVIINGKQYMSWQIEDQASQKMAIV